MSTLCLLQCTIFMLANTIWGSPSIVYFKNFGHQGNLGTSKLFGTSGSTGTETNKHTIRQSDILRMVPHLKKVINNCGKSGVLDSLIKLTNQMWPNTGLAFCVSYCCCTLHHYWKICAIKLITRPAGVSYGGISTSLKGSL